MQSKIVLGLSILLAWSSNSVAQHCAPIVESYLSEISAKHVGESIALRVRYTKNGGQQKKAYQAYVVAYLEKNRSHAPDPKSTTLLDPDYICVLHTQRIDRDEEGDYPMSVSLKKDSLSKKLIEHFQLSENDRTEVGGWGCYRDRIRFAVVVPFLDDKTYSIIEGLPDNRHECNYTGDRALLFQELPYRLSLHFGIVQGVKTEAGKISIEMNGDKPPKE